MTEEHKIEKFGTQAKKSTVIHVFRNGEKNHQGVRMVLKSFRNMEQLYQEMNKSVGVLTGAVRHVYGVDGKEVKNLEDFVDGENYICAGADKFDKEHLPLALRTDTKPKEESHKDDAEKHEAKSTSKKPIEQFGVQTEKAKRITIYQHGEKGHQGVKMVVHHTKFKTFDQLKAAMTKQVHLPTGVMQVFTLDGKSIKTLDEIQDETIYVVAGPEKFNKSHLPSALDMYLQ